MDPFSITSRLNDFGNSKRSSQLPFKSFLFVQTPVVSACPWTRCPSIREFSSILLSKFTRSPDFRVPRFVLPKVSFIAVTLCRFSSIFSTVRQTPLCETLWSIFNSWDIGDSIQKLLFVPWGVRDSTIPTDSMIPVNIGLKFRIFGREFQFLNISPIFAIRKSLKEVSNYANY